MAGLFVIDCSVTMTWCFEDEAGAYADRVLEALATGEGLVPPIWALEVANVLLVAERRGRLTEQDSCRFLGMLDALPIRVQRDRAELTGILTLARAHGLSSYDASYLDLAIGTAIPLATQDRRLRRAARQCDVPIMCA